MRRNSKSIEAESELTHYSSGLVYKTPDLNASERRETEKAFARLFASEDGKKVLGHLQAITFGRALGPASPDAHLRYIEGQRALVATILRLIDRGRGPE
ncbi:MAG: hypothetical protein ACRBCK_04520 [Alphaproteobacteria bacterium]